MEEEPPQSVGGSQMNDDSSLSTIPSRAPSPAPISITESDYGILLAEKDRQATCKARDSARTALRLRLLLLLTTSLFVAQFLMNSTTSAALKVPRGCPNPDALCSEHQAEAKRLGNEVRWLKKDLDAAHKHNDAIIAHNAMTLGAPPSFELKDGSLNNYFKIVKSPPSYGSGGRETRTIKLSVAVRHLLVGGLSAAAGAIVAGPTVAGFFARKAGVAAKAISARGGAAGVALGVRGGVGGVPSVAGRVFRRLARFCTGGRYGK